MALSAYFAAQAVTSMDTDKGGQGHTATSVAMSVDKYWWSGVRFEAFLLLFVSEK